MSICFGNINPGKVNTRFMQSLIDCEREKVFTELLIHQAGPYLDVARNVVVEQFYKRPECGDYLLFVDSDISFSPQNVWDLEEHASPDRVVSGVYRSYFAVFNELRPVLGRFTWDEKFGSETIQAINPRILDDVDEHGRVKVDGAGAGFLMFHRSLIENMVDVYGWPMPWFICQCLEKTKQWYGEDYMFCLRAAAIGVPTFAVPAVKLGHTKDLQM